MIKATLSAVAALLGLCSSLRAQEITVPEGIGSIVLSLDQLQARGLANALGRANPWGALNYGDAGLTLTEASLFSLPVAFDSLEAPPSNFPRLVPAEELAAEMPRAASSSNASANMVETRPKLFDHFGGEVGMLYGTSLGGKHGGNIKEGYILGETGNANTEITVGISYQESSGRFPRRDR
jgi:hypothetical protein